MARIFENSNKRAKGEFKEVFKSPSWRGSSSSKTGEKIMRIEGIEPADTYRRASQTHQVTPKDPAQGEDPYDKNQSKHRRDSTPPQEGRYNPEGTGENLDIEA